MPKEKFEIKTPYGGFGFSEGETIPLEVAKEMKKILNAIAFSIDLHSENHIVDLEFLVRLFVGE